jgi:hypothetical protein
MQCSHIIHDLIKKHKKRHNMTRSFKFLVSIPTIILSSAISSYSDWTANNSGMVVAGTEYMPMLSCIYAAGSSLFAGTS